MGSTVSFRSGPACAALALAALLWLMAAPPAGAQGDPYDPDYWSGQNGGETTEAAAEAAPDPEAEARELVQRFAGELKRRLQAAMAEGGPTEAIEVCAGAAPEIAARLSRESGAFVRRVSLKVRNPADTPDAWEQRVLARFDRQAAGGTDPATLSHAETVEEPRGRYFRFMKAIPTQGLCLACHGEQVAPAVQRILDERYPHDRATGYRVGMVRGAFSVKMPVE